jgi:anti-sigma regulatory factor (Ser/Thr protein kinase)
MSAEPTAPFPAATAGPAQHTVQRLPSTADGYPPSVTSDGAGRVPVCEHNAVLYRSEHDLSRGLRSSLQRAAAEESAVLICLDVAAETRIRTDFGSICEHFTFDATGTRDAIPGRAMAALSRFVTAAEDSGAAAAWSIGAIPLRADGRDVRWMHFEAAVNEIFHHRPLRAVCLYDAEQTPVQLRHDVERTHESVAGEWTHRTGDDSPVDVVVPFPSRPSDLTVRDPTPAVARAALEDLMGSRVSPALITDLQIVASELVTNAILHGAAPVLYEVWHEADGCAMRVTDRGPGGVDRFAHFRLPQVGPQGGFGLFTVGQLADSVEFTRHDDTTVVSVHMALR